MFWLLSEMHRGFIDGVDERMAKQQFESMRAQLGYTTDLAKFHADGVERQARALAAERAAHQALAAIPAPKSAEVQRLEAQLEEAQLLLKLMEARQKLAGLTAEPAESEEPQGFPDDV